MADINVEMLKEKLYEVASALFRIGETCVDVSKQHISEEKALSKIRGYLNDAGMWSRFKVDQLIEECMEPIVSNSFEDEWQRNYLGKWVGLEHLEADYPSCCDSCSNNPKNGGSGICNCILPYMKNPIMYNTGDSCMANNIDDRVYFANVDFVNVHKENTDRIAEAIERTKKYLKG